MKDYVAKDWYEQILFSSELDLNNTQCIIIDYKNGEIPRNYSIFYINFYHEKKKKQSVDPNPWL